MAIKWNEAQRAAIDYEGKSLLLSAAAGSGKTATLTQRILELIIDHGADLSRMLIVTFTRDAAAELKVKIANKLTEAMADNPGLKSLEKQIQKLEGSAISTTHSFMLSELRPHFVTLSLPPDFSVADEAMLSEMRREIMLDVVNDFFDEGESEFLRLADTLAGARDEEMLDEALLYVWDKLMCFGKNAEFLLFDTYEGDFLLSPPMEALRHELDIMSRHFADQFAIAARELALDGATEKYSAGASYFEKFALSIEEKRGYTELRSHLNDFTEPDSPRMKNKTDAYVAYMSARKEFRETVRDMRARYFSVSEEELMLLLEENRRINRALYRVISEFEKRFSEAKREKGKVDYNDMERLAVKLFVREDGSPTPEAEAAAAKYDHIFIDEYQDTNRLQDMVYTAFSKNAQRFMVGDIKQSIYGFRGARPDIFRSYRELYEKKDGGDAIFMSENHRCDSGIIDFSNLVSDYMFRYSETPFSEEDKLICSKDGGKGGDPAEVVIVKNSPDETLDPEAEYIADRIKDMISRETLRDGSSIRPRDVAILIRGGDFGVYKDALSRRNIPVNCGGGSFFERGEVLLILSLLQAVDNPTIDIPLCAVMKSPIGSFTISELVTIRGGDDCPLWHSLIKYGEGEGHLASRCRSFVSRINKYREMARSMPCHKLLVALITDCSMRSMTSDFPGERLSRSIKTLSTYAASVGNDGGMLSDLLIYLDGLMSSDSADDEGSADGVTISTIHASKGLEYPVCFIANTKTAFNKQDKNAGVVFDTENGVFMRLSDKKGLVRFDTPLRAAAGLKAERRGLDEEMRNLYVAMTRAREKLIITYLAPKKLSKADAADGISDTAQKVIAETKKRISAGYTEYSVFSAASLGQWILNCALMNMGDGSFTLNTASPEPMVEEAEENAAEFSTENVKKYVSTLEKRFSFVYDKAYLENIPAKLPVSGLRAGVLDGNDDDGEIETVPEPRFISRKKHTTAADAGTATHEFLQFCDFGRLEALGGEAEKQILLEKGFIHADKAELIRMDEIDKFISSSLFGRMKRALDVKREFRFNSMLPAWEFTEDKVLREKLRDEGVEICVQGVVDCLFKDENGNNVLVDYKTDRLTPEEMADVSLAQKKLTERHGHQLRAYQRLLEEMTGEKISEVLIYSLCLGDTITLT